MSENKIKTADEFLEDYLETRTLPWSPEMEKQIGCVYNAMIEFAKMHVKEALEQASRKVEIVGDWGIDKVRLDVIETRDNDGSWMSLEPDKESILNCYPPENIK